MKHYKDLKLGGFFGIDEGQPVPDDFIEVTVEQINAENELTAEVGKTVEQRIDELEKSISQGTIRAAVLGDAVAIAKLQQVEAGISVLRPQVAQSRR